MKKYNMMFTIWSIIVVITFGLLIALGYVYKGKVKEYQKFEQLLIIKTVEYATENNKVPNINKEKKVSIETLIDKGYLKKKDVVNTCSGYVLISHKKEIQYIPKIKCKYYKTNNKK